MPERGSPDGFFAGAQNDKHGDRPYLAAATRAADFIQRELYDEPSGVLYRSWREARSDIPGFAEDYACLIQGLLDLYEAGEACGPQANMAKMLAADASAIEDDARRVVALYLRAIGEKS